MEAEENLMAALSDNESAWKYSKSANRKAISDKLNEMFQLRASQVL